MTGQLLIDRVYRLLGDTPERRSDDVPFYELDEVIRIITFSRDSVFDALLSKSMIGNRSRTPLIQRMGRITISRMLKSCNGTANQAVPDDFWKLICGFSSTGRYIPAMPIYLAEAMASTGRDAIWARGGSFDGTAVLAYYWAKPSQPIAYTLVPLTDFNDGFYNCVVTLTALEIIHKENLDVKTRYAELENIFVQQLGSLR